MVSVYSRGIRVLGVALLLSVLFSGVITSAYADEYGFILKWGSSGSGDSQFNDPLYVAADGSGNVYVTDSDNNRVQKFTSSGVFILKWGSYGFGDGQFNTPFGVAVDGSGNVYVVDAGNYRVQKFTSSGEFVLKWGSYGFGDGQFNTPFGVAVDGSGNVYVVESGNNRVQKFTSSGVFVLKWGSWGIGDGQFNDPRCIAVDGSGNVYVVESGNNRVQKFTGSGVFVLKWSYTFSYPFGVAVDSAGNVYVANVNSNLVQKFTSSGVFILQWSVLGYGGGIAYPYGAANPYGVAVDGAGNVYVVDTFDECVLKFKFGPAYTLTITRTTGGDTSPPSPGRYAYAADVGAVAIVTAIPWTSASYVFDHWELDGVNAGSINPTSVTMNTNRTLHAVFTLSYSATINAYCNNETAGVSLEIIMDGTPTGYNTPHTFTGLSASHTFTVPSTDVNGHLFQGWSTGATNTTITVGSGGTYTAYYGTPYTLTITTTSGGTTSPSPGTYRYGFGTVVVVTAMPHLDHIFDHWELDGVNAGYVNPTSVTMNANHTLLAVFFVYIPPVPEFPAADISIVAGTFTFLIAIYFARKAKKPPNNVKRRCVT